MKLKRDFLWIVLFGTLIGLNETLLGGMHLPNKSIILSIITVLLLSMGRYLFPKIGVSLLMIAVASLYKITDLGLAGCKLEGMVMLGVAFEVFATLLIRKTTTKFYFFALVSFLAALSTFLVFALMQRYVFNNEYWFGPKFVEHIFIKGPITAVSGALISYLGVMTIKPLIAWYNGVMNQKPYIIQSIIGMFIIGFWFLGYFTA